VLRIQVYAGACHKHFTRFLQLQHPFFALCFSLPPQLLAHAPDYGPMALSGSCQRSMASAPEAAPQGHSATTVAENALPGDNVAEPAGKANVLRGTEALLGFVKYKRWAHVLRASPGLPKNLSFPPLLDSSRPTCRTIHPTLVAFLGHTHQPSSPKPFHNGGRELRAEASAYGCLRHLRSPLNLADYCATQQIAQPQFQDYSDPRGSRPSFIRCRLFSVHL
jgi:hypothetical protein